MSFVDLLFPQKELEALGNKWHEPAPKRRRLDSGRHNSDSITNQRRPRLSSSSQHGNRAPIHTVVKRSNSESTPSTTTDAPATVTARKSCLPTFIEPSILKNYLHHLHPNDRSRYTVAHSPRAETVHDHDDNASSPGSLTSDSSSPPNSSDNCPTPSQSIFEQLRGGPFGPVMYGLRITDHERVMMEDLLAPAPPMAFTPAPTEVLGGKRKATELTAEDLFAIDEGLLKILPPRGADDTAIDLDRAERDSDVHSSGLSPAAEEEEEADSTPGGIVMPQGSPLTMDDFFDLDEAAIAPSPLAI